MSFEFSSKLHLSVFVPYCKDEVVGLMHDFLRSLPVLTFGIIRHISPILFFLSFLLLFFFFFCGTGD
jgi:hypothetical protein